MKVTVEVPEEAIQDALNEAPAAIAYWGGMGGYGKPARFIVEHDGPQVRAVLNAGRIRAGLRSMAEDSPGWFGRLMRRDVDRNVADIFVQHCVFGEVKYG